MRKYHHLGIPTDVPREGEYHLPEFGVHVLDYRSNPYGVEWMRYEPWSPVPELVKRVPHLAFEVDDLEAELEGKEVLIPPNSPSEGVRVAFIVHDGAPIEFLEYEKKSDKVTKGHSEKGTKGKSEGARRKKKGGPQFCGRLSEIPPAPTSASGGSTHSPESTDHGIT